MKRNAYQTLVRPILTEDSMADSSLREPQYVFQVSVDANKIEIARAVEEAFSVRVKKVNTLRQAGKPKTMRGRHGYRAERKKAFVTLEEGQSIDLF
jgi:large subunit ribosomal protein L23